MKDEEFAERILEIIGTNFELFEKVANEYLEQNINDL